MSKGFKGGCLCGAVRYESSEAAKFTGHCHCVDCRKSSGTGHCSHMGVAETAVALTGKTRNYEAPADSGNIISRHFCGTCGCAVFSTNSGMPGMIFIRASSLDDPEQFVPQVVVYTSRAASWDKISGDLPTFETMPPQPPQAA